MVKLNGFSMSILLGPFFMLLGPLQIFSHRYLDDVVLAGVDKITYLDIFQTYRSRRRSFVVTKLMYTTLLLCANPKLV